MSEKTIIALPESRAEHVEAQVAEALTLLQVTDPEDGDAGVALKAAGETYRSLEDLRKRLKAPYLEAGRAVDKWFRPLKQLKAAMDAFKRELARIEMERERVRQEKLQAALERAKEGEIVAVPEAPPERATTIRKAWTFKVKDLSLVPAEYMMLNEAAVRAAIRDGVREIPGLEIYEDTVVARKV